MQRLMNLAMVEGFERWREHVAEEGQLRRKALKVLPPLVICICFVICRWNDLGGFVPGLFSGEERFPDLIKSFV
jgi:hypothetical protein